MQKLFEILKRFRYPLTFLILEGLCLFLIISNNPLPANWFFNAAGQWRGWTQTTTSNIYDYFNLKKENTRLANENAMLRSQSDMACYHMDSTQFSDFQLPANDKKIFEFIPAKVVGNSIYQNKNTILLNKGASDSISKDMGVIGPNGLVGMIVGISENFSIVLPLINTVSMISAKTLPDNSIGTISWDGGNIRQVSMRDLPSHVEVKNGDTVVTSGFSTMFPEGILIGFVEDYGLDHDKNYYKADIKLATDFTSLQWVYIIRNTKAQEQAGLIRISESLESRRITR